MPPQPAPGAGERTRYYREDNNPPGSGLAAIANRFNTSSTTDDDGKKWPSLRENIYYWPRRLMSDPQALIISVISLVLITLLLRFAFLSMGGSLPFSTPHFRSHYGFGLGGDVRSGILDPEYFSDFFVTHDRYDESLDIEKGIDAVYLAKNAQIALQTLGTEDAYHFHGSIGIDQDGEDSWTPTPLKGPQTREDLERSWKGYAFNSELAASLPLDRQLPDSRPIMCKMHAKWDISVFPSTSIGIVFHNENLAVLLRSVVSILNRTPPQLLREIVLVDDHSELDTHPWLGDQLDYIISTYPKVRLRRMTERQGLMMARIRAAEWCRGDVVIFLDSHIEVTKEWLEPLLETISTNPKTLVVPRISGLDGETLEFHSGGIGAITFSWSLGQEHLPDTSLAQNFPSPAMAGGLFGANRTYFMNDLGGYDHALKLYGGEEFELGFKTWMCGGRIEVVPCSQIGHIFRKDTYWKGQVYKVPGEEIARNKRRVAHVWMDEFAPVALSVISKLPKDMSIGDMTREQNIRSTCQDGGPSKSFQWYLDNVATSVWAPSMIDLHRIGVIMNARKEVCLDNLGTKDRAGTYHCHYSGGTQTFMISGDGNIRSAGATLIKCVSEIPSNVDGVLLMTECLDAGPWQIENLTFDQLSTLRDAKISKDSDGSLKMWSHPANEIFRIKIDDACLTVTHENNDSGVTLLPCDHSDASQIWGLSSSPKEHSKNLV